MEIEYTLGGGETWNAIAAHVGKHRIGAIEEGQRWTNRALESRAECWRCGYKSRWRSGTAEQRVEACKLALGKHVYQKHHELLYP